MQKLLDYCTTDTQRERIQAIIDFGSAEAAAKKIGVDAGNLRKMRRRLEARAAKQGYSPEHDMNHTVPDGFQVKGTSTLYDKEGNPKLQWVKSSIDYERQLELMRETVAAMSEEIPACDPVPVTGRERNANLLNQYTITDYHLGMKAWREETGASWDLDIAERTLAAWFEQAIASAPQAENCIFSQIGDFLHWDGLDAVTPTNRHVLDADTRFQKVVRVVIRVIRRIVDMLLRKYSSVHLMMAEGNHDLASSVWLREMFSALYENEPRVTVDDSADVYYAYEFGKVALFYHHGHKKRVQQMDSVFVAKFREMYGRTEYHYAHAGHLHHDIIRESNLMKVEQHRTLAAPDSHASRGGWMSKRDAKVITYHKEYGEVGRVTVSFDCVRDSAGIDITA